MKFSQINFQKKDLIYYINNTKIWRINMKPKLTKEFKNKSNYIKKILN